jgi:hypothetical protein
LPCLEEDLVSREQLYELVWSMPMTKVAEKFSVDELGDKELQRHRSGRDAGDRDGFESLRPDHSFNSALLKMASNGYL